MSQPVEPHRTYRYYDLVMAAFVTVLLCANLIGASKRAMVFGWTFGAGEVPRRSSGRGPPYWKSRVLRRQALGEEDAGQGRWGQETA